MIRRLFLLIGLISLVSCTNEIEESIPSSNEKQVLMTVRDFEWDKKDSRTTVDVTPEGVFYNWAENDTVGIVPNIGTQVAFPITNGVGSNTATFSGGAWALRPLSTYAAYYPFIGDIYLDKTKIPVSYEGQTQVGNASTAHLGKYDFMAAVAKTPETGNVKFDFNHLGCLVELNITLPTPGKYHSVTLSSLDAVFATHGTVDLTSSNPSVIADGAKSKVFTVQLKDFSTTIANEAVKVYFILPPTDLKLKTIEVKFHNEWEGCSYPIEIDKNWVAGKAYKLFIDKTPSMVEWIDLGLPSGIKWASHNIGALRPIDYGDYFAWGEISPKDTYTEENYLYSRFSNDGNWLGGKDLGSFSGNPKYDAATANWGAGSRMPTEEEFLELFKTCVCTWVTIDGIVGQYFSGTNGNRIFLPAGGASYYEFHGHGAGSDASFWSVTPKSHDDGYTHFSSTLTFKDKQTGIMETYRYIGCSVRPVRD